MDNDAFENLIQSNIKSSCNIHNNKIAVALSGGSDSLALTIALKNLGYDILAILVNHNLRKTSKEEIDKTIITLEKFSIKYALKEWSGHYQNNLEAEARENRYKLLIDTCHKEDIKYLFLGHHIDDQIETFLLNVARGSGLDGLCAMPKVINVNDVQIIRPMLNLSKNDCQNYLMNLNINWCEDESNNDIKYKRNKLRFLLEQIEDRDLITKRVCNTINILQEVRVIIDDLVDATFNNYNIIKELEDKKHNTMFIEVNVEEFLKLKPYLQKSVITKCILKLSNRKYKLRFHQMVNIIECITKMEKFKRSISKCIVEKKGNKLLIKQF